MMQIHFSSLHKNRSSSRNDLSWLEKCHFVLSNIFSPRILFTWPNSNTLKNTKKNNIEKGRNELQPISANWQVSWAGCELAGPGRLLIEDHFYTTDLCFLTRDWIASSFIRIQNIFNFFKQSKLHWISPFSKVFCSHTMILTLFSADHR